MRISRFDQSTLISTLTYLFQIFFFLRKKQVKPSVHLSHSVSVGSEVTAYSEFVIISMNILMLFLSIIAYNTGFHV